MSSNRRESDDFVRHIASLSDAELLQLRQTLEARRSELLRREGRAEAATFALPLLTGAALLGLAIASPPLIAVVYVYALPALLGAEAVAVATDVHTTRRRTRVDEQLLNISRE